MRKHVQYGVYVLRHKWFVFVACCHLGIPWRGIVHDWSKFLPCEWFPYVEKFYGGPHMSIYNAHGDYRNWMLLYGGEKHTIEGVNARFDAAWLHHQHYNKHHWQHWVLRNDDGDTRILPMPDTYRREMVADWRGAGRALGFPDTAAWYAKNREKIMLHPDTRYFVERELPLESGVR